MVGRAALCCSSLTPVLPPGLRALVCCARVCSGIPINDVDTNPAKGQRFPANGAILFDESNDESDRGAVPGASAWRAGATAHLQISLLQPQPPCPNCFQQRTRLPPSTTPAPHTGPYPFPLNASVEGAWLGCDPRVCSGDRHVLVRDNHTCLLYEGYSCRAPRSMTGKHSQDGVLAVWVLQTGLC